jgi:hypothetical protein
MSCVSAAARVLGLAFVLGACGNSGAPSIQSLGSGPANEAPLWVPRPGADLPLDVGDRPPSFAMTEDRMIGDRRVFAAGWQNPTPFFETGLGPAEPYFTRFYGRHADGIYLEGDTRDGLYEEPVLWVPNAVRVGMRWSHPPRWQFEVTDRIETSPVTWRVRVTDARRRTTNDSNTQVIIGLPYEVQYIEGSPLPPLQRARSAMNGPFPGLLAQDDPPTPAAPVAVPELVLRPLNGGEPLVDNVVPSFVGVVVDPDGDRIDLTIDGQASSFENSGVTTSFFVASEVTFCGRYSVGDDRLSELPAGANTCRDARGTVVDGQGRVLSVNNNRWQRYRYCRPATGTGGIITCNPENERMAGIFRAADGTAMVFREGVGVLQLAPHDGDEDTPMGTYGALVDADWASLERFPGGQEIGVDLWLPEPDATGWKLLAVKQNGLATSHIRSNGIIDRQAAMIDEGGNLGLTSDAAGRRVLRTHPDGAIERITWSDDGIHLARQPLARIGLAADRVLVGAVEVGDRLLVLTLDGYEGNDAQYSVAGSRPGEVINIGADRGVPPNLGHIRLWDAPTPATAPAAVPAAPITRLAFSSNMAQEDALVCGTSHGASLDGWSFGGVPAITFATDGSDCLTLATDKARPQLEPGVMRGSLPELGPFTATLGGLETRSSLLLGADDMYVGATPLADGSGFGACQTTDLETGACVAWRRFGREWEVAAEDLTAPPALAVPRDDSTCVTLAGATCDTFGLPLLDCRGAGAPGVFSLPTLAPYTTLGPAHIGPSHWVVEECYSVGDTLWLYLREQTAKGDQFHTFMHVDTLAWTFTAAPMVASGYLSGPRSPEGDRWLFFEDETPVAHAESERHPTAMVRLLDGDVEHFNLSFGPGGVQFHGPLLLGVSLDVFAGDARRVWRPDLFQDRLDSCGDGVLAQDEFCPEDRLCAPGQPPTCDADWLVTSPCATSLCDPAGPVTTCSDDGLVVLRHDCAVLCEGGACFKAPFHCQDGACVPNAQPCGAVSCQPAESCFLNIGGAPRCAVLPRCGDGVCASEEAGSDCVDCAPGWRDWDGRCSWFEQWRSDCGTCGDGRCNDGEDERCPEDCVGCGDSVCAPGERDRCPRDCPGCGNALCEPGEPDDFAPAYCPLDCLPCEADRPGCFDEGVISCDAAGAVVDYTPCPAGDLCVAGACVGAGICGNGRCEQDEVCPADCN